MKKFSLCFFAALLLVALFVFTGCTSNCMTPLCSNNAQLFSDFCRRCNDLIEGARDVLNLFN